MGRIFLTNDFDAPANTPDAAQIRSPTSNQQPDSPPRWTAGDGFPDEDAWWNQQPTFVENFVEQSPERRSEPAPTRLLRTLQAAYDQETLPASSDADVVPPAEPTLPVLQGELAPAHAGSQARSRTTISEDELQKIQLDVHNTLSVDADDFELAWDPEEDEDDSASSCCMSTEDDLSAPSTPLRMQLPQLPRLASFTASVPIPSPQRRSTASVPATPAAYSGFGPPSRSLTTLPNITGSPIAARSVARIRGFTVHSPRTELVL